MEINVGKQALNGMLEVSVKHTDLIDGLIHTATVTVWVEDADSRAVIAAHARKAARAFLARCLAAHEPDHQSDAV